MKDPISRRTFVSGAAASVLAAPALAFAQRSSASSAGALSDAFLTRLPKMMEWANVPGIAIATIADGKLAWSKGFGLKKAGGADAVGPDTLFGAASLSKPVFAYAIMRMREEKLIDIDRPLWEYLPNEDLAAVENAKLITVRHVLTHSSGLQNWRFARDQKLEIAFKPGDRFSYSGEGFYYLQRVAEKISGRGFEEFMRDRVLKPLGMPNSTYLWNKDMEARTSSGHSVRMVPTDIFNAVQGRRMLEIAEEWKKPVETWKYEDAVRAQPLINNSLPPFPNFLLPNTAGSLVTSVNEYAHFMMRLMDRGRRDENDLSNTIRQEMLAPQIKINSVLSWGLGVGLEDQGTGTSFWHWGDNGVFKAFMMGDPVRRSGIVVFTNAANGHRMWQRIVEEATGSDHAAFLFWMV